MIKSEDQHVNIEYLGGYPGEVSRDVSIELPSYLPVLRFIYSTVGWLFPRLAAEFAYYYFATPMRRAKHKRTDRLLEAVETIRFSFRDMQLQGYHWGTSEKKILLLHGWESRGTALRNLVPGLIDAGYSVWTFDAPAHGSSPGKQLTMPIYGAAIDNFRDHYGPFDVIITHSFGGAGALFSLSHKHSATPTKMIMVGVPSRITSIVEAFTKHLDMPASVQNAFWNLLESRFQRGLDEVELPTLYKNSGLDKILIIHDQQDNLVDVKEAYFLAANMPGSTLALTKGYGHFRILRQKIVINRIHQEIGTDQIL